MMGMGRLQRPKDHSSRGELLLGLYIRYSSGGVEREVWVGERERCELPSDTHRLVPKSRREGT